MGANRDERSAPENAKVDKSVGSRHHWRERVMLSAIDDPRMVRSGRRARCRRGLGRSGRCAKWTVPGPAGAADPNSVMAEAAR